MKRIIFYFFVIVITFSHQKILYGQNLQIKVDSTLFQSVLHCGLENYLNKIPVGKEKDFGFYSREEFNKIVTGNPMQIYCASENLDSAIHFLTTQTWKIPLIIDGSYRCFADISISNGEYKIVGIGLKELATDLDNYEKIKNLKETKNKALFIDYYLNTYFLVTKDETNNLEFFPFRTLPICNLNTFNIKDKYSSEEIFQYLINSTLKNEK